MPRCDDDSETEGRRRAAIRVRNHLKKQQRMPGFRRRRNRSTRSKISVNSTARKNKPETVSHAAPWNDGSTTLVSTVRKSNGWVGIIDGGGRGACNTIKRDINKKRDDAQYRIQPQERRQIKSTESLLQPCSPTIHKSEASRSKSM